MYEQHFGLTCKPFNATPDPRFLYFSRRRRGALARLIYSIREGCGLAVLVGDVGSGKTTIVHKLLDEFRPTSRTILVDHTTTMTREDALRAILGALGTDDAGMTRLQMIRRIREGLIADVEAGREAALLVIDEAQNLRSDVFEEIRLLTNLEQGQRKLLQVVLVGQSTLAARLEKPALEPVNQRIAVRIRLVPLTAEETTDYVRHRLRVAGCELEELVSPGAHEKIYEASRGVPRVINTVSEHALLHAFAAKSPTVDATFVERAMADCGLNRPAAATAQPAAPVAWQPLMVRVVGATALALVMIAGGFALTHRGDGADPATVVEQAAAEIPATTPTIDVPAAEPIAAPAIARAPSVAEPGPAAPAVAVKVKETVETEPATVSVFETQDSDAAARVARKQVEPRPSRERQARPARISPPVANPSYVSPPALPEPPELTDIRSRYLESIREEAEPVMPKPLSEPPVLASFRTEPEPVRVANALRRPDFATTGIEPVLPPRVEPPADVRTEPVVISRIEPDLGRYGDARNQPKSVALRVLVNEQGNVVRVVVDGESTRSSFEAAAINAVLRWKYRPAREGGGPVRAWVTEQFEFKPAG